MTILVENLPEGCAPTCPGCPHRHLSAEESETRKLRFLQQSLSRWSGQWSERIRPVQGAPADRRSGYRERTCVRAQWNGSVWEFGFLDPSTRTLRASERRVVPIPRCPVHSPRVREVLRELSGILPPPPRFPLVYALISGRILTLVLKAPPSLEFLDRIPDSDWEKLIAQGLDGVYFNFHPSAGDRVLSSRGWQHVHGSKKSITPDGLAHGPQSFQQLLPELYGKALDLAESFLSPKAEDAVIDLYCGLGASLKRWQSRSARAIGVELSREAIECAREHLLPGTPLLVGRCSDRIPQIRSWLASLEGRSETLVFANPPRTGLEPEILQWMTGELRPARIAYLSCSPGTLARDLGAVEEYGYTVEELHPWDFFPRTRHVETLALIKRLSRR